MKKSTLKFLAIGMFVLMGTFIMAQVTMIPEDATAFDEITLTLDVALSCPDSALFMADSVMMHSGVTIGESAWQNVIEFDALGANAQQPKLIYLGPYSPKAVSISPATASAYEEITLTIDTRLSCPDSALFGADSVMMHSAVNIDGTAWSNVVAFDGIGANGQSPKLMHNGDSTWSITFTPSEYYGIVDGSVVTQINCVFNNGSWDAEGKDFNEEGGCTDFNIPFGEENMYKWAITFIPSEFYGIEEGTDVSAINCVFNGGDWSAGEGKAFTEEGECTDFLILFGGSSIGEGSKINSFKLFPNPVENELNINGFINVNLVEVYNVTGQLIRNVEVESVKNITINVADLNKGVYIVNIQTDSGIQTSKFIKN